MLFTRASSARVLLFVLSAVIGSAAKSSGSSVMRRFCGAKMGQVIARPAYSVAFTIVSRFIESPCQGDTTHSSTLLPGHSAKPWGRRILRILRIEPDVKSRSFDAEPSLERSEGLLRMTGAGAGQQWPESRAQGVSDGTGGGDLTPLICH